MQEEFVCPVCGDTTSSYMGNYRKDRLCRKHATDLKKGLLLYCDDCKSWYYVDESCECNQTTYTELPLSGFKECVLCGYKTNGYAFCKSCFKKHTIEQMLDILNNVPTSDEVDDDSDDFEDQIDLPESVETVDEYSDETTFKQNNVVIIDHNSKSRCITCGRQTDGLLFCSSCYHKYKNKELLFRITNCSNVEMLDDDYEGKYTCKDGHIVKSKSEREIDNYLFEHGISHAYERELPYGSTEKEVLHPDFYLPNYLGQGMHVYIEHWGYNENNINYTKSKKFKMSIYKQLEVTLICTYESTDVGRIDTVLDRKLNKKNIQPNIINYEESSSNNGTPDGGSDLPF